MIGDFNIKMHGVDFEAEYPIESYLSQARSALTAPYNKFRETAQYALSDQIYRASSCSFKKKLNPSRLDASRDTLRKIGGETFFLKTPDGEILDTMYFNAKKFRKKIVKLGGQFEYSKDSNGQVTPIIKIYSTGLRNLLTDMKGEPTTASFLNIFKMQEPYQLELSQPSVTHSIPTLDEAPAGVRIIGQGNGCIYEFDRAKILFTLLNGSDCMALNIRGTGRSSGVPTENGTYLDYETTYQFLTKKLNYKDEKITASGYCLSSGPATDLASKHPINLEIDRGFDRVGDLISQMALNMILPTKENRGWKSNLTESVLSPLISTTVDNLVISYNVGSKIEHVKGSIWSLEATDDHIIPKKSAENLKSKIENAKSADTAFPVRLTTFEDGGHNELWDQAVSSEYQSFQAQCCKLRNFGVTTPLAIGERISNIFEFSNATYKDTNIV